MLVLAAWALGPRTVAQVVETGEAPRNARELATFRGDKVGFTGVAFSPDGQRLLAGGVETTAKVWDLTIGRELFTVTGGNGGTFAVAYSPDGRQFLTGGDYGASLWDAETGRRAQTLPPPVGADWLEFGPLRRRSEWHGQRVEVVAFSPNGKRVLTGANDGKVIVWDAARGESLLMLRREGDSWIHAAAFSPDGLTIAVASYDGKITLWDAQGGHVRHTLTGYTNAIESLAYFPDGTRIVIASYDNTARILDTRLGSELLAFRGHRGAVMCVAVSPDGRRVATGSTDRSARVWDSETGQEQLLLQGHRHPLDGIAFSPDGRRVATTGFDQTIRLWDVVPEVGSVITGAVSELRLESDYIPLAMRLEGDPLKREIRSVRLTGKVPSKGDGAGEIWLDTRPADLNLFGDVVRRIGGEPAPIRVELRYVATNTGQTTNNPTGFGPVADRPASRGFRLYDLVFPGGVLGGRLQLVLGTATLGPHRLLAYGPAPPNQDPYLKNPGQIVALHGDPPIRSALPDAPLGREIDLTGYYTAVDRRIHLLEVQGTPGDAGKLAFNPNRITFDPFGEPVTFTMMGYQRHETTLKPEEGADPLGQGRRLYWAVSKDPRNTNRVAVVLGRTEIGPHRILLYHGDEVAFIVPAHLAERRRQEIQASESASLSTGEQQALADLRLALGYGFRWPTTAPVLPGKAGAVDGCGRRQVAHDHPRGDFEPVRGPANSVP
jgi:WD40 repeat protein